MAYDVLEPDKPGYDVLEPEVSIQNRSGPQDDFTDVVPNEPGLTTFGTGDLLSSVLKNTVGRVADLPTEIANRLRGAQDINNPAHQLLLSERPTMQLPQIPQQQGIVPQTLAGVGNLGINAVNSFVPPFAPPEVGLTLPLLGGSSALAKTAAGAFALPMLEALPEQTQQAYDAWNDPKQSLQDTVTKVGEPLLGAYLGTRMLNHAVTPEPFSSGLRPGDIESVPFRGDIQRPNMPMEPTVQVHPLEQPPTQVQGEAQRQLTYPPRQIEGPKGEFIASPTGQVVNKADLSPQELTELMRGSKEFVPREQTVRPAQESPALIGEPTVNQGHIDLATEMRKLRETIERQQIVPASQSVQRERPPLGGQVSFDASANAQAIPNANQSAVESSSPLREVGGLDLANINPGLNVEKPTEQASVGGTTLSEPPASPQAMDYIKRSKPRIEATLQQSVQGLHELAAKLREKQLPETPSVVRETFRTKERELRSDAFSLTGPRVAMTPSEVGFNDVTKPVDAVQLRNRIKNKVHPTEWGYYDKVLPTQGKISAKEAAQLMQESGPKVGITSYGQEGKVSAERQELNDLIHELDTIGLDPHLRVTGEMNWTYKGSPIKPEEMQSPLAQKMLRYSELLDIVKKERIDTYPRATSAYGQVSAFDTKKYPVKRVDVTVPGTEKWAPDGTHETIPNTIGWAMVQYVPKPDGTKVAYVNEVQSRWGQEWRKEMEFHKAQKAKGGPTFYPGRGMVDHPLLTDHNRLILKAVIDQAKKDGVTKIVLSDAESAMMTEKHDQLFEGRPSESDVTQAGGMRANYDSTYWTLKDSKGKLVKDAVFSSQKDALRAAKEGQVPVEKVGSLNEIMQELTGQEGAPVTVSEHKNAYTDAKPRSNLIFRNANGTPKTTATGREYDVSKVQTPFSLFGKDKPAQQIHYFYGGLGMFDPRIIGPVVKGVADVGAKLTHLYSEPLIERIGRLGGPVAKQVSKEAGQIVSSAKKHYGALTQYIDPAKEAVGKMTRAYAKDNIWLRKLTNVTDKAAISNTVGAIEGTGSVPSFATKTVGLLRTANLEVGRLAARANPSFVPSGKMQRMWGVYGLDIVRRGHGPGWDALTQGNAAIPANAAAIRGYIKSRKLPVSTTPLEAIQHFFRHWKSELDKPGLDAATIDKINQDFVRYFPQAITHIKPGNVWHEVLITEPFSYLENAAQRTAHAVAFREVYKPGTGLLAATQKAVMSELPTDRSKAEFDNLVRALQGHPIDTFTSWWNAPDELPGAASRMTGQLVATPLRVLMLSGNLIGNAAESLVGGPAIFLGFGKVARATLKLGDTYAQHERNGALNRAMYNWAYDPKSPGRSVVRQASHVVRKVFAEQILNELQEAQGAGAASIWAQEIRGGTLSTYDKDRLVSIMRAMGIDKGEARKAVEGHNDDVVSQFERHASAKLSGGNVAMAERSRMGASRLFNELFWFHNYPQMVINQFRKVAMNMAEDWESKDWNQFAHNSGLMGKMVGGRLLQGALTIGFIALAQQGMVGLREKIQEAIDEFYEFTIDSGVAAVGGPSQIMKRSLENSGDSSMLAKSLAGTVAPLSAAAELYDAGLGNGKYEGLTANERIGKFIATKTPGWKVIKTGMALFGLTQTDQELETAITALGRWKRQTLGASDPGYRPSLDEDKAFRAQVKRSVDALRQGKDWRTGLQGLEDKDKLERSLQSRTFMTDLKDEQIEALRKHIGSHLVDRLQQQDAMVRQVARELRAAKGDVTQVDEPTGQYAQDFETGKKRQQHVAEGVSTEALDFLKQNNLKLLGYNAELPKGHGRKDFLTIEDNKVLQEELVQSYNTMLQKLMDRRERFESLSQDLKDKEFEKWMTTAKRIAENKTRRTLREQQTQGQ